MKSKRASELSPGRKSGLNPMKGAHLFFYSHEPAYKMTYDCWLDIQYVDDVNFLTRVGTHFVNGCTWVLETEWSIIPKSNRFNVTRPLD